MKIQICLAFLLLLVLSQSRCAYQPDAANWPHKLNQSDDQSLPFNQTGLTQCLQYNGKLGCCNQWNDKAQAVSYSQIDHVFGYEGGGCDHCAINLKRFWCEYACSPNQADFFNVTSQNSSIIDPADPSRNISVQMVTIAVDPQTACDLYSSCKRVGFVSSVSAMGSPAGFLVFQGHNAADDSNQYIDVVFSKDKTKALTLSDEFNETQRKALEPCNTKVNSSTRHQFKFNQNCKCNTCDEACDASSGFIYTQSSVFEGFNWILVGGTYIVVGVIAALLTYKRSRDKKIKLN